jgi:putative ABC transport system permease protein
MESLLQDLRFAARILRRSAGTTFALIAALALGIGANSAMYSVVDASLLHPVNYADPQNLAVVWELDAHGIRRLASAANFLDWRARNGSFSEIAAREPTSYVLTGGDRSEQVRGAAVTANFFRTLGVKPVGRVFLGTEDGIEDPAAASHVCLIGYSFWRERLGGDPRVLGRTLTLDGTIYTVIGVLPADFWFVSRKTQVWVPISLDRTNRDYRYLLVLARLKTTLAQSSADLGPLAHTLSESYPQTNKGWGAEAGDLREWVVNRSFRARILLLAGALVLILTIACTNAASLLLARASARTREIATRVSLGATRSRLIRQLLTESLLIALAGGAAGLAVGRALMQAARALLPPNTVTNPAALDLNTTAILVTLAVALATGVIFGLAPALTLAGTTVQGRLRDSTRSVSGGRARQLTRKVVVTAEVALAFLLLPSTALMLKSIRKLGEADLGFRSHNVLAWSLFLPAGKYDASAALRVHRRVMERIEALPGVEAATVASGLPLQELIMEVPFDLERSPHENGERNAAAYQSISSEYLQTLGIPLKRGRGFTDGDDERAPAVALVNDTFVERFLPNQNPVGERVWLNRPVLGGNGFGPPVRVEIAGVIGNVALGHLAAEPYPTLYVPHAQNVWRSTAWFAIRTRVDATTLAGAVRREMEAVEKNQPIDSLGTLEQTFDNQFAEPRFQAQLMGTFAALALLLAVSGVYSINAEAVVQRRHEIGLRLALGASAARVLREAAADSLRLTVFGIGLGVMGAVAFGSWLKSAVAGVSPTDPLTLGGVAAVLAMIAAIACVIPAHNATRIDPAVVLREE